MSKVWRRLFVEVTDEVRLELIGSLFHTKVPIALGGLTLALVLLHSIIATNEILVGGLAVAGAIVTAGRLMLNAAYLKAQASDFDVRTAEMWERRYAVGCVFFSSLIGITGSLAFQNGNSGQQLLATALVFAYAAGAVCRISVRPAICLPAVILAVVPTAAASGLQLEADHLFYGIFLLVFVAGCVETIRFLYHVNVDQISLKHDFAELARHDVLTGLANRLGFKERLKGAVGRAYENGDMVAIHSIDLDRFKEANDKFGHPVGDALLQAVAGRLNGILRDDDFAVRLGGDEFVIVQVAMGHPQEALLLARRAIAALNERFAIDGREIFIGASIGIAIGREPKDMETLMSAADAALYKSKANGRNRATFAHLAEAESQVPSAGGGGVL